jgi:hypothetical protein
MKLLNLYIFITLILHINSSLIPTKKICIDCKHFIGDSIECRKFSDTNLVTGKISYDYARSARENKEKCGEDAIHFEKNHFKIITVPYYFLKNNYIVLMPSFLLSVYLYLYYILHK